MKTELFIHPASSSQKESEVQSAMYSHAPPRISVQESVTAVYRNRIIQRHFVHVSALYWILRRRSMWTHLSPAHMDAGYFRRMRRKSRNCSKCSLQILQSGQLSLRFPGMTKMRRHSAFISEGTETEGETLQRKFRQTTPSQHRLRRFSYQEINFAYSVK